LVDDTLYKFTFIIIYYIFSKGFLNVRAVWSSYPSGHVAVSISRTINGLYTLLVLSDAKTSSAQLQQQVRAVFESTGCAVVYYPNSQIRLADAQHIIHLNIVTYVDMLVGRFYTSTVHLDNGVAYATQHLASPAMGHWGTCLPPSTSNCLIFLVTSEPHKLCHGLYKLLWLSTQKEYYNLYFTITDSINTGDN